MGMAATLVNGTEPFEQTVVHPSQRVNMKYVYQQRRNPLKMLPTDGRWRTTGPVYPISSLRAFGSGELKNRIKIVHPFNPHFSL